MASHTTMTPLKKEVLEKEDPEIRPDSPLLDLSDAAIKKLMLERPVYREFFACQFFYDCKECGVRLKPKPGDCCVFCSYGSVPCPPIQRARAAR
jgi:hypothetical protein